MLERERLLGRKTDEDPRGLIYPVKFADGDHFPQEAKDTQPRDLSEWNFGAPIFRETAGYLVFDKEVQKLSEELAAMIQGAPDWKPWPVVTPAPVAAPPRTLTRL